MSHDLHPVITDANTVEYWSVYRQQWVECWAEEIPDQEYAAMDAADREALWALAAQEWSMGGPGER